MTLPDLLRLLMRLVHTAALAVWLGGGLFYALGRLRLGHQLAPEAWAALGALLGSLTRPAFALLAASGVYLMFDRLSDQRLGGSYLALLAAKLGVVAAILLVLGAPRSPRRRSRLPDRAWLLLWLGAAALALGVALTWIYEVERISS